MTINSRDQALAFDLPDPGPGCPRCRLDLIRFTADVPLPRFTMCRGETWRLPQSRYQENGSAAIGGGFAPAGTFEVLGRDVSRAIHGAEGCG